MFSLPFIKGSSQQTAPPQFGPTIATNRIPTTRIPGKHLVVLKHRNNRLLHFSAQAISTSSRLHRVAQQQGSTLLSEYIHPPVNDDQEEQQAETPTFTEAMNGPNAAGFLKAMEVGMYTLLSLMETFDDVVATK
eukprot:jgi/Psemu1/58845/gm1.58845_g